MNTLLKFQSDFLNTTLLRDVAASQSLKSQINATAGLSADKQISIYSNSIHSGFVNALENIYPVCLALTGERFFYTLSSGYILQQASSSPDLAQYGENFYAYISQYKAADPVPYLSDIAKLEWAYHTAFHSQNEIELDISILQPHSKEDLLQCVFSLPVSHCLIKSRFPIDKIWEMHPLDMEKIDDNKLEIEYSKKFFYLYRRNFDIHLDSISEEEYIFLNAINTQQAFIRVCEQIADELSEQPNLANLLGKSLQLGWINHAQLMQV